MPSTPDHTTAADPILSTLLGPSLAARIPRLAALVPDGALLGSTSTENARRGVAIYLERVAADALRAHAFAPKPDEVPDHELLPEALARAGIAADLWLASNKIHPVCKVAARRLELAGIVWGSDASVLAYRIRAGQR